MNSLVTVSAKDWMAFNQKRQMNHKKPVEFVRYCVLVSDFKKKFTTSYENDLLNAKLQEDEYED